MRRLLFKLFPLTNNFGLRLRSLLARPWYLAIRCFLLTLCMSAFYVLAKLLFVIPPRNLASFVFFRRGGLEASTDLLLIASAALLIGLLVTSFLTLRMQARLSWQADHANNQSLIQIGLSLSEQRHSLRLEGLIAIGFAALPSLILSKIILIQLTRHWDLDALTNAADQLSLLAIMLSFMVTFFLLELSYVYLGPPAHARASRSKCESPPLYQRYRPKQPRGKQIRFEIRHHGWRHARLSILADLLTLGVVFTIIFFISAAKAGIKQPQIDRIANSVSYDLYSEAGSPKTLEEDVASLLSNIPDTVVGRIDVRYLSSDNAVSFMLDTEWLKPGFRDRLAANQGVDSYADDASKWAVDFYLYPLNEEDYIAYWEGEPSVDYQAWVNLEAAILIPEIQYAGDKQILIDRFTTIRSEAGDRLVLTEQTEEIDSLLISDVSDRLPWFIDPVTNQLGPRLLISETLYLDLFDPADSSGRYARLRVDESALISIHTIVLRDWNWRHTKLQITDHHSRRLEQMRIHYALGILFNVSLFYFLQLALVALIGFTQSPYFTREQELDLLYEIGLGRRGERRIVRTHVWEVFIFALLSSYLLTYVTSQAWNYFLRPITAVTIRWPYLALLVYSLLFLGITAVFAQIRLKKRSEP